MKRFAAILFLFGSGFVFASLALLFINFNPTTLQGVLTSDGAFDPLAVYAFSSLKTGLLIAGTILLALAWLFHLIVRGVIKFQQWSTGKFLLVVIGAQFILSLVYISSVEYTPSGDSVWYLNQAENIAKGIGVVTPFGQPTAFWPVGYPFFLSLFYRVFGVHIFIAQLLSICFFCGISYLVYRLGLEFFEEKTARLATLVAALIPSQIFYALLPLADVPFSFIVILVIYLNLRKINFKNSLLTGFLLGIANIIRPNIIFYPLILAGSRLLTGMRFTLVIKHLLLLFLICEIVMLPWQIRNYKIFKEFVMVSNNAGYNLAMGNNARASGGVMSPQIFIPSDQQSYYRSLNETQQDHYLSQLGFTYILEHPGHAILLGLKKLVHLYYKDSKGITYGLSESFSQLPAAVVMGMILVTEGYYYSLGLAFLIAFIALIRKYRLTEYTWLIGGTVLYFTAVFLPFIAEGRYHMPLLPLFALVVCSAGLSVRKGVS